MAEQRDDRTGGLDPAILLVDMDSFFASVEVRDDPSLTGRPVIVGGDGGRGVVASCTYEARRFGVRSAMPMATAKRLCPEAVVLPGRMGVYAAISRELKAILVDHSPLVEPLGLDEAFVDVTGSKSLLGTPFEIATSIRQRITSELELNCGIGIGSSKSIAKLASRDAKPRIVNGRIEAGPGICVVMDDEVRNYLDQFPVRALFGVGPATAKTLANLGIERVSDLAALEPEILSRHVGHVHAHTLIALARGEDPRPVVADQASKSIGNEETYATDVVDRAELEGRVRLLAVGVSGALRSQGRRARTITLKVKFADFRQVTRSHTMVTGIDDHVAIASVASALLGTLDVEEGVRLVGISASNLESADLPVQLQLLVERDEVDDPGAQAAILQFERAALDDAIDEIRARFGRHVVGTASMLEKGRVNVPSQRTAPFGPGSGGPRTYDED